MTFSRDRAHRGIGIILVAVLSTGVLAAAQQASPDSLQVPIESPQLAAASLDPALPAGNESDAGLPDDPGEPLGTQQSTSTPGPPNGQNQSLQGRQTKRILGILPNFTAVSADTHLPPQSPAQKFKAAAEDSFDYSSLIFVGMQAGLNQLDGSYPEFHQGAAGYGRYYWHTLADDTDENLWVEFLIPVALHQDIRYYTLGHGGFPKRLAYAVTRIIITRNDAGSETFNASEVFGAGIAAGISNLYYPAPERTEVKTYQRWVTNISIDDAVFILKEFWPDINNKFFHQKD